LDDPLESPNFFSALARRENSARNEKAGHLARPFVFSELVAPAQVLGSVVL
jgi:hypothetical protein